ncbi:hypothetical protein ACFWN5_05485 [Streptomyces sp. NPDC058430]|uniref:hypothetical protein n=1 Tax=Streptomyces sp. NPDC058430 TaxID=3346495 RepID=UPI0036494708
MNIAGIEFLIRDHGGQFTDAFDAVCADVGLRVLKSPPPAPALALAPAPAPKANAHCERFIGTLRREPSTGHSSSTNGTCAEPSPGTWSTTTGTGLTAH